MFRKFGLAALASAVLASACCIGPALLLALGIGSVGATAAATFLAPYRPLFLGLAVLFLAGALLQLRKQRTAAEACAADGTCSPAKQGRSQVLFGVLVLAVLMLGAFPVYSAYLANRDTGDTRAAAASPPPAQSAAVTVSLQVANITCDACVPHIQQALAGIPGILDAQVDEASGTVLVHYRAGQVQPPRLVQALAQAGYPARIKKG